MDLGHVAHSLPAPTATTRCSKNSPAGVEREGQVRVRDLGVLWKLSEQGAAEPQAANCSERRPAAGAGHTASFASDGRAIAAAAA